MENKPQVQKVGGNASWPVGGKNYLLDANLHKKHLVKTVEESLKSFEKLCK